MFNELIKKLFILGRLRVQVCDEPSEKVEDKPILDILLSMKEKNVDYIDGTLTVKLR